MRSQDFIESLLAVLGVYEILRGITAFVGYLPLGSEGTGPAVWLAAHAVAPVLLGGLLIAFRSGLARRLAPLSAGSVREAQPFDASLLVVAGVFLCATALVDAAALAASEAAERSIFDELAQPPHEAERLWPARVKLIAQFVVGVAVALGSSGLARAIRALRYAGRGLRE